MIPYLDLARANAPLRDELSTAAVSVIEGGWFILGNEVQRFEDAWASYTGRSGCVGVGNALDGLTLALRALGAGPGDEILVPSNTYIASWLAVSAVGATPVPVEPDEGTMTIRGAACAEAVTSRTVGVMPVHLFGQMTHPDVSEAARAHGLFVLADAAQSHGATVAGKPLDTDADVYSFYPTKNLGALGDAGAVVTNSEQLADRVRLLRNYGSRRKYDNEVRGYNSRLDDMQAAFLSAKLPHLRGDNERRREIAAMYAAGLGEVVGLPLVPEDTESHVWHAFNVRHGQRDRLQERLAGAGVGTQVFYPTPPHRSQAYADRSWPPLPIADRLAETTLALPVAPYLADEEVSFVIDAVRALTEELAASVVR
ncbi:MAG: aminotransferase [Frankiales bacterium]|nr:aminotransferase [Frankiales bacterium]